MIPWGRMDKRWFVQARRAAISCHLWTCSIRNVLHVYQIIQTMNNLITLIEIWTRMWCGYNGDNFFGLMKICDRLFHMKCWCIRITDIICLRYGASQCGPLNNALNPTLGLKNSFIALIFRYIAVHNRLNPTLRLCLYQFLHTMRSWRETIHHDPQNVQ